MDFQQSQPIFLQIADWLSDKVISGEIPTGGQMPSVREIASETGVNPNTVQRAVERLLLNGIIQSQRGKGNFLTTDARERIINERKQRFFEQQLPRLAAEMRVLGLPLEQIERELEKLM